MTLTMVPPNFLLLAAVSASLIACAASLPDDPELGLSARVQEQSGVAYEGDHPKPSPKLCGGTDALSCDEGHFCNSERAAGGGGCGVTEVRGVCEALPERCTYELRQVCGCDHRTYATDCVAHMEGVSVLHEGGCIAEDCAAGGGTVVAAESLDACPAGQVENGWVHTSSEIGSDAAGICCVPRMR